MKKTSKTENMVTPSFDQLSRIDNTENGYNKYTLAIAVAKSSRLATDEIRNQDPAERTVKNPIRVGLDRIYGGEWKIDSTSVDEDDKKLKSGN